MRTSSASLEALAMPIMALMEPILSVRGFAAAFAHLRHLLDDIVGGLSGQRGVLGPALAVGQVAIAAGEDIGLAAMQHDLRARPDDPRDTSPGTLKRSFTPASVKRTLAPGRLLRTVSSGLAAAPARRLGHGIGPDRAVFALAPARRPAQAPGPDKPQQNQNIPHFRMRFPGSFYGVSDTCLGRRVGKKFQRPAPPPWAKASIRATPAMIRRPPAAF